MRDFDPTAGEFAGHDAIRIGSRHYDPGTLISAGASLLGSSMASDAAGDAAATQAAATREANALQEKQYNQTRNDLAPWRNVGGGAVNKLAQLLGISASPTAPASVSAADRDAIRQRLLAQFTTTTQPTGRIPNYGQGEDANQIISYSQPAATSTVDEAGLNAAIEREIAAQAAQQQPQTDPNAADYGSLLKQFTGEDLANEPGYQFGLKQGQQQLDRRAASGGNYFSGAALKAAARYGNDYASTKFNDAFNRDASSKRMTYDFLNGQSTSGQNAATMTANAGTQMAGQVGANTTSMGNALGAAAIAQGNAWQGGAQNAVNGYQQNALMKAVLSGNTGWAPAVNDDGYSVGQGSAYGGSRRGM
jgi:hypothetical protein